LVNCNLVDPYYHLKQLLSSQILLPILHVAASVKFKQYKGCIDHLVQKVFPSHNTSKFKNA
jgi:hypothetical protein